MKKIIYIFFISIYYSCYSQNLANLENPNKIKDWKLEGLKNKVSKIFIVKSNLIEKFGESAEIKTDSISIFFNSEGSYLSKFNYSLSEKWYLNCIKSNAVDCSSSHFYREYDSSNCLVSERGLHSGAYNPYSIAAICKNGKTESQSISTEEVLRYYYDKNGNCIKIENYSIKGNDETIRKVLQYSFNLNNKIIDKKVFDNNGNLKEKYSYKYDLKLRLISEEIYLKDYNSNKIKNYTYDEKNNIVSLFGISDKSRYGFLYKYIYDTKGNITEEKEMFPNGEIISLNKYYNYDTKGNWRQKVEYTKYSFNTKPKYKINRTFEYFDSSY